MSEASAPVVEKSKAEAPKQTGAETSSDQNTQQSSDTGKGRDLARKVRRFFNGKSKGRSVGIHEGMEALSGKKSLEQTTDITKDAAEKTTATETPPTETGLHIKVAQVTDAGGEDVLRAEAALLAHERRGGSKEGPSIAPIAEDATRWEKTKHIAKELPRVVVESAKEAIKHPGETARKMYEDRIVRGASRALQERSAAALLVSAGETSLSKPLLDAIQSEAQQEVSAKREEKGAIGRAGMTVKEWGRIATQTRRDLEKEEIQLAGKLNEAVSTPAEKQSPELKAFIEKHRSKDQGGTGLMEQYIEDRSGHFAAKAALAESEIVTDYAGAGVELTGKSKETFAEALAPIVQQKLLDKQSGVARTKAEQVREQVAIEQALMQTALSLPDGEVKQQILSAVSRASDIAQGVDALAVGAEQALSHVKGAAAVEQITDYITALPSITIESGTVTDTSLAEVAKSRSRVTKKAFQRLQEAQGTPEFADAMRTMDHAAARAGMLESGMVESGAAALAAMGGYAVEIGGRKAGRVFGAFVGGTAVAGAFGARRGIEDANLDIARARTDVARGKSQVSKEKLKQTILPMADMAETTSSMQQSVDRLQTAGGDTQSKLENAFVGLAQYHARTRVGDELSTNLWKTSEGRNYHQDSIALERKRADLAREVAVAAAANPDALKRIAEKTGVDVTGANPEDYVSAITSSLSGALESNIQTGVDLGEQLGGVLAGQGVERSLKEVRRAERNHKVKQSAIETSKIAAFSAGMLGAFAGGEAVLDGAAASAQGLGEPRQTENLGNTSLAGAATIEAPVDGNGSGGGEPLPIGEDPLKLLELVKNEPEAIKEIKETTFVEGPTEQGLHTLLIPDEKNPENSYVRLEMNSDKAKTFAFEIPKVGTVFVDGETKDGKTFLDLSSGSKEGLKFANGDKVMVPELDAKGNPLLDANGQPKAKALELKDVSKLLVNAEQVQAGIAKQNPDMLKLPQIDVATEMQSGGAQTFNFVDTISAVNLDADNQKVEYYSSIHGGGIPKDFEIPGKNGVEIPQGGDQKAIAGALEGAGFEHKGDGWVKDGITISDKQIAEHVKTIEQMQGLPNNVSPEFNAKGQLNLERDGKVIAENVTITDKGEITYELNGKSQPPLDPEKFIEKLTGEKTGGTGGSSEALKGALKDSGLEVNDAGDLVNDKNEVVFSKAEAAQMQQAFSQLPEGVTPVVDVNDKSFDLMQKGKPIFEDVTITADGMVQYKDLKEPISLKLFIEQVTSPSPEQKVMIAGEKLDIPKDSAIYKNIDEYNAVFKGLPKEYDLSYDKDTDSLIIKDAKDVNLGEGVTITKDGNLHGKFRGELKGKDFILEKHINNKVTTIPLEKLLNPVVKVQENESEVLNWLEDNWDAVVVGVVSVGTIGALLKNRERIIQGINNRLDARQRGISSDSGGTGASPEQNAGTLPAATPGGITRRSPDASLWPEPEVTQPHEGGYGYRAESSGYNPASSPDTSDSSATRLPDPYAYDPDAFPLPQGAPPASPDYTGSPYVEPAGVRPLQGAGEPTPFGRSPAEATSRVRIGKDEFIVRREGGQRYFDGVLPSGGILSGVRSMSEAEYNQKLASGELSLVESEAQPESPKIEPQPEGTAGTLTTPEQEENSIGNITRDLRYRTEPLTDAQVASINTFISDFERESRGQFPDERLDSIDQAETWVKVLLEKHNQGIPLSQQDREDAGFGLTTLQDELRQAHARAQSEESSEGGKSNIMPKEEAEEILRGGAMLSASEHEDVKILNPEGEGEYEGNIEIQYFNKDGTPAGGPLWWPKSVILDRVMNGAIKKKEVSESSSNEGGNETPEEVKATAAVAPSEALEIPTAENAKGRGTDATGERISPEDAIATLRNADIALFIGEPLSAETVAQMPNVIEVIQAELDRKKSGLDIETADKVAAALAVLRSESEGDKSEDEYNKFANAVTTLEDFVKPRPKQRPDEGDIPDFLR